MKATENILSSARKPVIKKLKTCYQESENMLSNLNNFRPTKATENMLSNARKHVTEHQASDKCHV
jgi:hypothetical protein